MVELITFGTKMRARPRDCLLIYCADLPNPHKVGSLKNLNGRDHDAVRDFVYQDQDKLREKADLALRTASRNPDARIAFACVGGQHRSPAVAEFVASKLRFMGVEVTVTHMEL